MKIKNAIIAVLTAVSIGAIAVERLTEEERAKGAAIIETFGTEVMPQTFEVYQQVCEKMKLMFKNLKNLEVELKSNGEDPENNETYKTILSKYKERIDQRNELRDIIMGFYMFNKMDIYSTDEILEEDKARAAALKTEYLTRAKLKDEKKAE